MDFWGTLRLVRRRWIIALPALLLAIGLTFATYLSVPTRYESRGVMVLTSSSTGPRFSDNVLPEDVGRVNPLLAFDGSLSTTAQILAQILRDPATVEQLGAGEKTGNNYTVNSGDQQGPFVFVTVDAVSAAEAQTLVGQVLQRAVTELDNRQRELQAPEPTFIRSQVLIKPTKAEPLIGGKVRFAGAAMIISLILVIGATFAGDSVIDGLRRARGLPPRSGAGNPLYPPGRGGEPQRGDPAWTAAPAAPPQPVPHQPPTPRPPEAPLLPDGSPVLAGNGRVPVRAADRAPLRADGRPQRPRPRLREPGGEPGADGG